MELENACVTAISAFKGDLDWKFTGSSSIDFNARRSLDQIDNANSTVKPELEIISVRFKFLENKRSPQDWVPFPLRFP